MGSSDPNYKYQKIGIEENRHGLPYMLRLSYLQLALRKEPV